MFGCKPKFATPPLGKFDHTKFQNKKFDHTSKVFALANHKLGMLNLFRAWPHM